MIKDIQTVIFLRCELCCWNAYEFELDENELWILTKALPSAILIPVSSNASYNMKTGYSSLIKDPVSNQLD